MMIHPSCAKFYLIVFYSSSIAIDSHNVQWDKTKQNSIIWLLDYFIWKISQFQLKEDNKIKIKNFWI